jgi:hypothetical protein
MTLYLCEVHKMKTFYYGNYTGILIGKDNIVPVLN